MVDGTPVVVGNIDILMGMDYNYEELNCRVKLCRCQIKQESAEEMYHVCCYFEILEHKSTIKALVTQIASLRLLLEVLAFNPIWNFKQKKWMADKANISKTLNWNMSQQMVLGAGVIAAVF